MIITTHSINKIVFETLCIEVPKNEDLYLSAKTESGLTKEVI